MSKTRFVVGFAAVLMIAASGCSREFHLTGILTGSTISSKGLVTEKSLSYSFDYKKQGKYSDLFNFIYFEGDTVCFSFDFNNDIDGSARVYFINPATKKRILAERIETLRSRVYGFSLVGSLLEHFNAERLGDPVSKNMRIIKQPFVLQIELERHGKIFTAERPGEFVVNY